MDDDCIAPLLLTDRRRSGLVGRLFGLTFAPLEISFSQAVFCHTLQPNPIMNVSIPKLLSPWESGITNNGLLYAGHLLLPAAVSLPVIYGLVRAHSLRNSETLQTWRKNYANFEKLSRFVLPGKDKTQDPRLYSKDLAIVATCSLLSRIFNALIPILLRRIVDQLADTADTSIPIVEILIFVALRQVISEAVNTLHWNKLIRVESEISNRLMCALYDKALTLSADYHDAKRPMDTYVTIVNGGPRFGRFVMSILFDKTTALVDLLVAVAAFWRLFGAHLALAMAAIAAIYIWAAHQLTPTRSADFATVLRLRREQDRMGGDALRNWHTVTAFNNVTHEQARFRDAAGRTLAFRRGLSSSRALVSWKKNVVLALGFLVLSLMTTVRIKSKGKDDSNGRGQGVGDYVMLLQYWNDLAFPIQNFVSWASWFDEFFVESDKMIEILEAQPTIRDKIGAPEFKLVNGDIEFDQVGFSYQHEDSSENGKEGKKISERTAAVKNVSFKVPGGTTVAIVGETGGGKSTLLRLLCRLYDVDAGSIRVDGQDIRDIRLGSLMRHISIVPQIISVFNDTVTSNLKYGNFAATQQDCEAACEAAALHKKITGSFPDQYDEIIGERGTNLSGGELQRLAIARVLLRDSKIVLFDEAMSSLDSETEWKIQGRLRAFCQDRTVVIIAHRLATVAHADLILAVKDGVIVESGRQEELLAKGGYYYNLWDKQRLQSETTCR